jgi:hypothetical protein
MKAHLGDLMQARWTDARRAAHSAAIRAAHARGAPLGRPRQRAYWPSVAEAGRRVDAQLAARSGATYRGTTDKMPSMDPTRCLWSPEPVVYVPVLDDPRFVRDLRKDPIQGGGIAGWADVHAVRHTAELARVAAERKQDAAV